MNNEIKVGDKFSSNKDKEIIVEVFAVTKQIVIYAKPNSPESSAYVNNFTKTYTPYQEPLKETVIMEIKVGDKFVWVEDKTYIAEILAVTSMWVIYSNKGTEYIAFMSDFLNANTPYQEPTPVKKIVAFESYEGSLNLCFEGSHQHLAMRDAKYKRVELTPEMLGWKER